MGWLFERMIELAAWVAFVLGAIFFIEAVILLFHWMRSLSNEPNETLLTQSATSAASFVAAALALGSLACIDRYVFDVPDDRKVG